MRRQIKPFTIERKRSGRAGSPADQPPLDLLPPQAPPPAKPPTLTKWAAAEALFSVPAPERVEDRPAPDALSDKAPTGRILQSLVDAPSPEPSYDLEEEPPKRRGRKPGSRNKLPRTPRDAQGPKTINIVVRDVFEFWALEDDASEDKPVAGEDAPSSPAPLASVAIRGVELKRRGRLDRLGQPRGQRWKARLPRFAR